MRKSSGGECGEIERVWLIGSSYLWFCGWPGPPFHRCPFPARRRPRSIYWCPASPGSARRSAGAPPGCRWRRGSRGARSSLLRRGRAGAEEGGGWSGDGCSCGKGGAGRKERFSMWPVSTQVSLWTENTHWSCSVWTYDLVPAERFFVSRPNERLHNLWLCCDRMK